MLLLAGAAIAAVLVTTAVAPAEGVVQGASRRTGPLDERTRERLAFIARALDAGHGSAEAINGRTVRSEYDSIIAAPMLRDRADVTPTLRRVEALRQIESGQDAAWLVSTALEAPVDRPEQTLAAWRRLTQRTSAGGLPLWPLSGAELRQELAMRGPLQRAIGRIPEAARQAALRTEVAGEQARRHRRVLLLPREDRDIETAVELMDEFGLDAATLDERLRYNVELARFKARTLADESAGEDGNASPRRVKLSESMLAEEAMRFRAKARQLPGGVQFLGEVKTLLDGLAAFESAATRPPGSAAPSSAVRSTEQTLRWTDGPGALPGAKASYHGADRRVVRFTLGGQDGRAQMTLEFIALAEGSEAVPGQPMTYVGTREISVAAVAQAVEWFGSWSAFVEHVPIFTPRDDPRPGVRTWMWTTAVVGATPELSTAQDFLGEEAVGLNRPRAADGVPLGTPTIAHPMNWVSADAANYVAGLLGCRLPTATEWLEVDRLCGSSRLGEGMNLRDQSMAAQASYLSGLRATGIRAEQPDAGSFSPVEGWGVELDAAHAWNDRAAYLRRTDHDSGLGCGVHDLIGNVAELVSSSGGEPADWVNQRAGIVVIGGSAFSPAGSDPRVPRVPRPEELAEGWSDVGFRLAFTAAVEAVQESPGALAAPSTPERVAGAPDLTQAGELIAGARYLRAR